MATKTPSEVAKRSLCLELLLQRIGLELDEEDHVDKRDAFRLAWVSRLGDLELDATLLPDERAFLTRPVDALTQEEVDDIEGRVISAVVLLWALGRAPKLPAASTLGDAPDVVAEHGVLGDGSVSGARETVAKASLRPEAELRDALSAAERARGDVSQAMTPEQMVAGIALHALGWVLDPEASFGNGAEPSGAAS
jgi:hypothetical protein